MGGGGRGEGGREGERGRAQSEKISLELVPKRSKAGTVSPTGGSLC